MIRVPQVQLVEGQRIPRGYGMAYFDYTMLYAICYPVPFHWLVRIGRNFWTWVIQWKPGVLDEWRRAMYEKGRDVESRDAEKRMGRALAEKDEEIRSIRAHIAHLTLQGPNPYAAWCGRKVCVSYRHYTGAGRVSGFEWDMWYVVGIMSINELGQLVLIDDEGKTHYFMAADVSEIAEWKEPARPRKAKP